MNKAMEATVERWLKGLNYRGRPNEHDGKRLLAEIGIAVPEGILLETSASADYARQLCDPGETGHFAIKVCSPDVLHKTERNGVALGIEAEELTTAVTDLRSRFPGEPVLVERMIPFQGPEMILGALYDPTFGVAVMAGAGGIFTELYRDVVFRLAPCSRAEAKRMLSDLAVYPALTGLSSIELDVDSLSGVIEKVAELACLLIRKGRQLDINPLVWDGSGWVALDAKIVL